MKIKVALLNVRPVGIKRERGREAETDKEYITISNFQLTDKETGDYTDQEKPMNMLTGWSFKRKISASTVVTTLDTSFQPVLAYVKAPSVLSSPAYQPLRRRDHGLAWSILLLVCRSQFSVFPQLNQTRCNGTWTSLKA